MPTDQPIPSQATAVVIDPRVTEFTGATFALFDLYRANIQAGKGAVIEGRTFTDCYIEGPGVMLVLGNTRFDGTNFGPCNGNMGNMLFRSLSGEMAIGAIPVRDCTFKNCQFNTLGITGNDELLQILAEQVKTAG